MLNMMFQSLSMFVDNSVTTIITFVVIGVVLVAMFVVNYIMGKKNKKKQQDQLNAKKQVGDVIVTIGGIKGTWLCEDAETMTIETGLEDRKTTLTIYKGAVQSVNPDVKPSTVEPQAAPVASAEQVEPFESAKSTDSVSPVAQAETPVEPATPAEPTAAVEATVPVNQEKKRAVKSDKK